MCEFGDFMSFFHTYCVVGCNVCYAFDCGVLVTCEKGCESCIAAEVAAATMAAVAPNCELSPPPLIPPVPVLQP